LYFKLLHHVAVTPVTLSGITATYTPNADYNGPDSFTYTASDSVATSTSAVVNITVNPVNDTPAANPLVVTLDEDQWTVVTLSGLDPDGDPLTFAVTAQPTNGTLSGTVPNLVYTPAANFNGSDSFTYTASDSTDTSAPAVVSITVTPVNDAPVSAPDSFTLDEDTSLSFSVTGTDVDDTALTFEIVSGVTHGTLAGVGPGLVYTPAANYFGSDSFTYVIRDSHGAASQPATISFEVSSVNDAPVANSQSVLVAEDTAALITLTASDVDGDPLSYTITGQPAHVTIEVIGAEVTYTPNADYTGEDSFSFTASDSAVTSASAVVSITVTPVNDIPVAAPLEIVTDEDQSASITLAGLDAENDPLTFDVTTQPAHGILSGTAPDLVYTPAANYNGPDSFTYTVSDSTDTSEPAVVSITVAPINDAPVADAKSETLAEDDSLTITLTGSDVEGDTLTFSVISDPAHGSYTLAGSSLTYTPAANFNGTDAIVVVANDGTVNSAPATITLTVTPVNDTPIANAGTLTLDEDTSAVVTLTGTDLDGDALTYAIATQPAHGTVALNGTNATYTPNTDFNGSDSFSFIVSDSTAPSAPAVVQITVSPVNDAPIANAGTLTLDEDGSAAVTLTGSDIDGDTLIFAIVDQPAHGTVLLSGDIATFTPAANYSGADSFSFKVNDGTADSAAAVINITVTPANDAPLVNAGPDGQGNVNTAIVLNGTATDDGLPLNSTLSVQWTQISGPAAGVFANATVADTTATFSEPGTYVLALTATDGALSASDELTITVVTPPPSSAVLEIMAPLNGETVQNGKPMMGAHYAGTRTVFPDSFRIILDGMDFSAEAMIDYQNKEVMFTPLESLEDGQHIYHIDWIADDQVVASDEVVFTVDAAFEGTRFIAEVRSTTGEPLQGVAVHVQYETVYTGPNGRFVVDGLPPGQHLFKFDTANVTNGLVYAPVNLSFEVLDDKITHWERPIYVPEVDESKGVAVTSESPNEQIITNPDIPGVMVIIPANTRIAFPDGSLTDTVTLIEIPVDRSPNCMGADFRPHRLFTLQPENTRLTKPATFVTGNDFEAPENSKAAFYSLNFESGLFTQTGVATITGNQVRTDSGSGFINFDWHVFGMLGNDISELDSEDKKTDETAETTCSTMPSRTGSLQEDHALPPYMSLGASRSIGLHYSSAMADPDIMNSMESFKPLGVMTPNNVRHSMTTAFGSTHSYVTPADTHFTQTNRTMATLRLSARNAPTGTHTVKIATVNYFPAPQGSAVNPGGTPGADSPPISFDTTKVFTSEVINGRELYPGMGNGWSFAGVDRLVLNDKKNIHLVSGSSMMKFTAGKDSFQTAARDLGFESAEETKDNSGMAIDAYFDGGSAIVTNPTFDRVENLGFVRSVEGRKMALLSSDPKSVTQRNALKRLYVSLGVMPANVRRISVWVDMLTDGMEDEYDATSFTVECFGEDSTSPFPRNFHGPFHGGDYVYLGDSYLYSMTDYPLALAGADTGYQQRAGFRQLFFDVPAEAVGIPCVLTFTLHSGSGLNNRCAALIDGIKMEVAPEIPAYPHDDSVTYSSPQFDTSDFQFDGASTTYRRRFPDGSMQIFDAEGRQIQIKDLLDNTTIFAYTDGNGDGKAMELSSVTDPVGLVTSMTYSANKLSQITDPAGRITSFIYDGEGNLTQITNPDNSSRGFTYDTFGKMTSQRDAMNHFRHYSYNPAGRLQQVQRADGAIYNYGSSGNPVGFLAVKKKEGQRI